MKNFFKPHHFPKLRFDDACEAADVANEKLATLIESWPVVYGCKNISDEKWSFDENNNSCTHKARLAFIEELPKEPCDHLPVQQTLKSGALSNHFICRRCGVELQATWSEK